MQYITKATFASCADKYSAIQCANDLEAKLIMARNAVASLAHGKHSQRAYANDILARTAICDSDKDT